LNDLRLGLAGSLWFLFDSGYKVRVVSRVGEFSSSLSSASWLIFVWYMEDNIFCFVHIECHSITSKPIWKFAQLHAYPNQECWKIGVWVKPCSVVSVKKCKKLSSSGKVIDETLEKYGSQRVPWKTERGSRVVLSDKFPFISTLCVRLDK